MKITKLLKFNTDVKNTKDEKREYLRFNGLFLTDTDVENQPGELQEISIRLNLTLSEAQVNALEVLDKQGWVGSADISELDYKKGMYGNTFFEYYEGTKQFIMNHSIFQIPQESFKDKLSELKKRFK